MTAIIDFHTHAFPDKLASKAIPALEKAGNIKAVLNGTISGLLHSMEQNRVEKSVICSIATNPDQFEPIFEWSAREQSEKIIPFPSIHPLDNKIKERIQLIKSYGFKGIKLHPYYQDFFLDQENVYPIYENAEKENLIIVIHCGFDIAFPKIRRADPEKILNITNKFQNLKLMVTHLGGWQQWDEVETILTGKKIFMETSFALNYLAKEKARTLLLNHPEDYLFFGTDSPWADQEASIQQLRDLELPSELEDKILYKNAKSLLGEH
jgi:uncharacterized protein